MSEQKEEVLGLDAELGEIKLSLKSSDNEKFEVEKKVALQSELIKTITDGGMDFICYFLHERCKGNRNSIAERKGISAAKSVGIFEVSFWKSC